MVKVCTVDGLRRENDLVLVKADQKNVLISPSA